MAIAAVSAVEQMTVELAMSTVVKMDQHLSSIPVYF